MLFWTERPAVASLAMPGMMTLSGTEPWADGRILETFPPPPAIQVIGTICCGLHDNHASVSIFRPSSLCRAKDVTRAKKAVKGVFQQSADRAYTWSPHLKPAQAGRRRATVPGQGE